MKQKPRVRKFKYYYFHRPNGEHVTCAVSAYHGKNYMGMATCAVTDTYDPEFGRTLAAAKCFLKIKNARYKYLKNLWSESIAKRIDAEIEEETLRGLYEQAFGEKESVARTVAGLQG